jgi:lipopolysaccharide biosynthesis glycosyltransferase
MDRTLQRSTWTKPKRHFGILKAFDDTHHTSIRRVLCFGCSRGFEIEMVLDHYKNASVVGVDIDDTCVQECKRKFAQNERVTIYQSESFVKEDVKSEFDLVLCLNVLCKHPATPEEPMLPLETYRNVVQSLWQRVSCDDGALIVYGANWKIEAAQLDEESCKIVRLKGISTGPIACYDHDDKNKVRFTSRKQYLPSIAIKYTKKTNNKEEAEETKEEKTVSEEETHDKEEEQKSATIITFGIFKYSLSSNIGDYTQTLAQINVLSVFYTPSWHVPSPQVRKVFEYFAQTKPSGNTVRNKHTDFEQVHVVWVDRDDTWDIDPNELPSTPIYCIANGWYMHYDGIKPKFPFAEGVIEPLFVSVHIAKPEILDDEKVVKYLKKYGPVGCRDTATMHRLHDLGLKDAYFSGCLTLTLESHHRSTVEHREIEYEIDIHARHQNDSAEQRLHLHKDFKVITSDMRLARALEYFEDYANAKSISGTRIHAIMPASAVGTPNLWFTSPTKSNAKSWNGRDRFTGLIDNMYNTQKRELMACVLFERLTDTIETLLVSKLGTQAMRDTLHGRKHSSLIHIDHSDTTIDFTQQVHLPTSWASVRLAHPAVLVDNDSGVVDACIPNNRHYFYHKKKHYILRVCRYKAFDGFLNILVTFDNAFVNVFKTWLSSLSNNNKNSLCRVFCHTRNVDHFDTKIRHPCQIYTNVVLFHRPVKQNYQGYTSPLTHVNECCLDRLDISEIEYRTNDVNRMIYMDIDILVLGDISQLMHIDTGVMGMAAKSSKVKNVVQNWLKKYDVSEAKYPYSKSFNAGVVVVDIDKLNRNNYYQTVQDLWSKYHVNDQILLNMYAKARYSELEGRFNVFVGQDDNDYSLNQQLGNASAKIVHFIGSHKPWKSSAKKYKHSQTLWKLWHSQVET